MEDVDIQYPKPDDYDIVQKILLEKGWKGLEEYYGYDVRPPEVIARENYAKKQKEKTLENNFFNICFGLHGPAPRNFSSVHNNVTNLCWCSHIRQRGNGNTRI